MNGALYKRGNIWWMSFNRNGRQFRISSKTDVRSKAEGMLKQEIRKTLAPSFSPPEARKVLIADLVADLFNHFDRVGKTKFAADQRSRWALRLDQTFGGMKACDLGTTPMNAYRDAWHAKGLTHTTINRDLQLLRRAFRLAAVHEPPKVERVPNFALMREDNARKVFITEAQVEQLRKGAATEGLWARVLIEMAYLYGWRKSELLGLCVQNVNLAERRVRLETSKNGEAREVPLTDSLIVLVTPLVLGRKPDEKLFPVADFRYAWPRICQSAGVTGIVFHDFRRTSARAKRAAGVDTSIILAMQGWKTEAMFRRYCIVDNSDKLEALERLESKLPS